MLDVDFSFHYPNKQPLYYKHTFLSGLTIITGASGCGKTTLLSCICGILRPCSGIITFQNQLWNHTQKNIHIPIQQRKVGILFQSPPLLEFATMRKNLSYFCHDFDRSFLDILEIQNLVDRKPEQLSGGERQRFALAIVLSLNFPLILLDEPFSALDEELKRRIIPQMITKLNSQKQTILMVTHQPQDLAEFSCPLFLM